MSFRVLRRLQNPELVKNLPTHELAKDGKLKKSQLVYVCGFAGTGSLGVQRYYKPGKDTDQVKPKEIMSSTFRRLSALQTSDKVKDIACGQGFTIICGNFKNTSQTVLGFGLNSHSQIGYHAPRPGYPLEVVSTPSPVFVPSKSPIVQAACGRAHSMILAENGSVFSMGDNSFGQCGRPIQEKEEYFGKKTITKVNHIPSNIERVECGQDHSFFLTTDGELYSCGWSADGQTGLGHFDNQPVPAKVKGDISGVKIIKVSSFADTVLAIDGEGNLFGWGNTEYAQFRQLTNSDSLQFDSPRHLKLKGISGKIVDIAAGGTICALLNDLGQVYVWGFGILGLGPGIDQSSKPRMIPESLFGKNLYNSDVKVDKIYASLDRFAAVSSIGDLYTWGRNRGASLGFKHAEDQYFPMRVDMNLALVKRVALGVDHTCALGEKVC